MDSYISYRWWNFLKITGGFCWWLKECLKKVLARRKPVHRFQLKGNILSYFAFDDCSEYLSCQWSVATVQYSDLSLTYCLVCFLVCGWFFPLRKLYMVAVVIRGPFGQLDGVAPLVTHPFRNYSKLLEILSNQNSHWFQSSYTSF